MRSLYAPAPSACGGNLIQRQVCIQAAKPLSDPGALCMPRFGRRRQEQPLADVCMEILTDAYSQIFTCEEKKRRRRRQRRPSIYYYSHCLISNHLIPLNPRVGAWLQRQLIRIIVVDLTGHLMFIFCLVSCVSRFLDVEPGVFTRATARFGCEMPQRVPVVVWGKSGHERPA